MDRDIEAGEVGPITPEEVLAERFWAARGNPEWGPMVLAEMLMENREADATLREQKDALSERRKLEVRKLRKAGTEILARIKAAPMSTGQQYFMPRFTPEELNRWVKAFTSHYEAVPEVVDGQVVLRPKAPTDG